MNDLKTWLTFSFIFGGSVTGNRLLERFGSPAAVLSLDPSSLLSEGEITERMAQDFGKDHARRADFILSSCLNFGWQILTPDSPLYPKAFDKLRDRPAVLYALGDVSLLNAPKAVSVVGTRGAAPQAKLAAYRLGKGLSERGIVTVSGGAVGVDSAAHEGALLGRGGTVGVLGCGFGDSYLPSRVFLRRRIARTGVLITEMHPFEPTSARAFPNRNRMIAALGNAVCVMQSGESGGSMSTAKHAKRCGVRLFALSPEVFRSPGCDLLLKQGATELRDLSDVLSFLGEEGSLPLRNEGSLPPSLRQETLTLEQFAFVNGVSPEEARPVWAHLRSGETDGLGAVRILRPDGGASVPVPTEAKKRPEKKKEVPPPAEQAPEAKGSVPGAGDREKTAKDHRLDPAAKKVWLALEGEMSLDALAEKAGLPAGDVLTAATVLELEGLCESLPGNRLRIK